MDNQQGPSVLHVELYSVLGGSLDGRSVRMDMCICMAESFRYSPGTITTLFVNCYTPIQHKVKKKKQTSGG